LADIKTSVGVSYDSIACAFSYITIQQIKGGGHATNPGFSSTQGIQIALLPFSDITFHSDAQRTTVGTGVIWDHVYSMLEEYGMDIVGRKSLPSELAISYLVEVCI
jgi:hypothetical protein